MAQSATQRKVFTGKVVSTKMPQTLVVRVEHLKKHPKYGKFYMVSRKYKVHCGVSKYAVGALVSFVGCRPISKDKKWRVIKSA